MSKNIKTYIGGEIPPHYFTLCQEIFHYLISIKQLESEPLLKNISLITKKNYEENTNFILITLSTPNNTLWEISHIAKINDYDWKIETVYLYDVWTLNTKTLYRVIIY